MTPYDSLKYLIDGDGHWMNRWCCTNHDIYLLGFTILACLWMNYEYIRYGINTNKYIKFVEDPILKSHLETLKSILIQCSIIHFVSFIVCWFWTPYYLICVLLLCNSYTTRKLNSQRTQILLLEAIKSTKTPQKEYEEFPTLKQQLQYHIDKLEGSCKWTQS
mgnify:CR=1 FL=1